MNLLVGKILSLEADQNGIWTKGKIEPPIVFEDLRKVLVVLDFP
jgi:cell shape-determining protein MreC